MPGHRQGSRKTPLPWVRASACRWGRRYPLLTDFDGRRLGTRAETSQEAPTAATHKIGRCILMVPSRKYLCGPGGWPGRPANFKPASNRVMGWSETFFKLIRRPAHRGAGFPAWESPARRGKRFGLKDPDHDQIMGRRRIPGPVSHVAAHVLPGIPGKQPDPFSSGAVAQPQAGNDWLAGAGGGNWRTFTCFKPAGPLITVPTSTTACS